MKQFIIRTLGFALLLCVLLVLLRSSVPFHWGEGGVDAKFKYFLEHQEDYNTVAIGSSRLNRGLIPRIFDNKTGKTSTFNLSWAAVYHLESEYLLDRLVQEADGIENVIFLVQYPRKIAKRNFHSIRSKYLMDRSRLGFALDFFKKEPKQIYRHVVSYIENKLCIGEVFQIAKYHWKTNPYEVKRDGFYTWVPDRKEVVLERIKSTMGEDVVLKGKKFKTRNMVYGPISEQNKVYYDHLLDLNKKLAEKGIETYFVHLPNQPPHEYLSELNNVYMGDGVKFPEYFLGEFHIDQAHLNEKGARLFSRRLGTLVGRMMVAKAKEREQPNKEEAPEIIDSLQLRDDDAQYLEPVLDFEELEKEEQPF